MRNIDKLRWFVLVIDTLMYGIPGAVMLIATISGERPAPWWMKALAAAMQAAAIWYFIKFKKRP